MQSEGRNESPGSEARRVFEAQAQNVVHLLGGITRDIQQLNGPIEAIKGVLAPNHDILDELLRGNLGGLEQTSAIKSLSTNFDTLGKHHEELDSMMEGNMRAHPFLFDWMLAMMVTFAEAYLENALLLLTASDPTLMATNDRLISGSDLMKIEADPPEVRWQSLMVIMRQRWTTQFLREKPGVWISRLEKFGVPKYRAGLADEMAVIWKRRHEIVHGLSAVRSIGSIESDKARYTQSMRVLVHSISVIDGFVEATDAFVVSALESLRSSHAVGGEIPSTPM